MHPLLPDIDQSIQLCTAATLSWLCLLQHAIAQGLHQGTDCSCLLAHEPWTIMFCSWCLHSLHSAPLPGVAYTCRGLLSAWLPDVCLWPRHACGTDCCPDSHIFSKDRGRSVLTVALPRDQQASGRLRLLHFCMQGVCAAHLGCLCRRAASQSAQSSQTMGIWVSAPQLYRPAQL